MRMVNVCLEFSPAACWSIDKDEVLLLLFLVLVAYQSRR